MRITVLIVGIGAALSGAFFAFFILKDRTPASLVVANPDTLLQSRRSLRADPEILTGALSETVSGVATSTATTTFSFTDRRYGNGDVTHVATPESVKAVYMTSWIAGTPHLRERILSLLADTEANAVVIDIKDDTGKIAFLMDDPAIAAIGSAEARIRDIETLIADLHVEGVYVIGRVAVFQDPYLAQKRPDLAVQKESDGSVWRDRKGLSWLDAGAREVWEYVAQIGHEAYATGFDEINFDYVRFPSDGNLDDITYPVSGERTRTRVMKEFFAYIGKEFGPTNITTSADLFGLTTVERTDLGIGQLLEDALPHFDYIAPMVYPSHYADGFQGHANPAAAPYEVVRYSLDQAVARAAALEMRSGSATTTQTAAGEAAAIGAADTSSCTLCKKIRPWLQDFDLGAEYDASMVRAQIRAVEDAGLHSWMLWDPSNYYTRGALHSER